MALADFRFRKTGASAALSFLNDRLPSAATITDQAGGQVVTVNVDDTYEADLVDLMAELGFALIEGTGGAGVTGTSYDDHEQRQDLIKSPVRVRDNTDLITGGWTPSGGPGKNKILTSPNNAVSNNDFDGVTFTAGVDQRVLLTGIGTHNGIYFLSQAADGATQPAILKRAYDADEDAEVKSGMAVPVVEGSSAKKVYLLTTTGAITVDTTSLTFEGVVADSDATENMLFGAGQVGSSTTTRYLFPCYSDSLAQTSAVQFRASRAGTLRNLRVRHNITAGNGNNIVYTVRKNGAGTTLTVTSASTTADGSDVAHTVGVAAGDLLDIEITKAAGIGASPRDVVASVEFA
jgi:hypothetical protein